MAPLLEGLPAKAKEAPSPHKVRLAPLNTNPVFQCLRETFDIFSELTLTIFTSFDIFKILWKFVNFYPNFQIFYPFLPFFWKIAPMLLFSGIGPENCQTKPVEFFQHWNWQPLLLPVHRVLQIRLTFRRQFKLLPQIICLITLRIESSIISIDTNITDNIIRMSRMYIRKSVVPRVEPWATPELLFHFFFTLNEILLAFNQLTRCFKSALTRLFSFFDRVTQT